MRLSGVLSEPRDLEVAFEEDGLFSLDYGRPTFDSVYWRVAPDKRTMVELAADANSGLLYEVSVVIINDRRVADVSHISDVEILGSGLPLLEIPRDYSYPGLYLRLKCHLVVGSKGSLLSIGEGPATTSLIAGTIQFLFDAKAELCGIVALRT